jgi:OFA family oxalate/formate antiporter-like MFS transporter
MSPKLQGVWAVVGGCLALAWPGTLVFGYPGVMGPHWQEAFGVGRAAVGATLFFVLAGAGTFMFVVGHWQQRYGARRMVLAGGVICAASLLVSAFAPSVAAVYVWAFCAGAASGFVYLPSVTVAQLWWPRRRGLASGIVNLSFGAWAAVLAPVIAWLVRGVGYTAAHLVLAPIVLAVGAIASTLTVAPHGSPARGGPGTPSTPSLTPAQSLRTGAFWCLWTTWALQGAAGIAMVTLSTHLGLAKGFSFEASLILLTAFNLGNGVSRLLMGFLSDVINRNIAMSATFFAAGIAYLALPGSEGLVLTGVLAATVGFAFGTLFAVSAPLAMECFGPAHFGAVFGLVFTAYGYLSGALGPWLGGYLVDAGGGSFTPVCSYFAVFCALAGVLILQVKPSSQSRSR